MVHSVSGCTLGVQVKLWDPLRTRAIPERLRGVITTRRYTNPRLPLPLPRSKEQGPITCRPTLAMVNMIPSAVLVADNGVRALTSRKAM